ncbi:NfeD family protein [Caldisalinibacter kiritimatiensis]|uniref:Uncharacterized protein n=1 Tax=Caldisalinibacter kiritimatiensis TaxID=1304284 RepID=R1CZ84_9FIRM|nr:NfeD family protein [Caldisalinibacter kiritimatiensis]EOD01884.1 hypothetical protein L21TH_0045 [Caldisalinibacter kiritimatiensis]
MLNKIRYIFICFSLLIIMFLSITMGFAQTGKDVYVIPIKGDINKATYQFVDSKIEEVSELNPAAIIFEIDTYGGRIDYANEIKESIMKIDYPTIAYVNTKAESAGVLVTVACEKIVMSQGATIGSAETIPNTEKAMSLWLSWLRDTSTRRGRDSVLVSSMADKDIEIEGVVEKGELLNLNSREANEIGFTDLVSNNYREILNYFDIEYAEIVKAKTDLRTNVARILTNPYISSLLLSIGFIGLLVEIFAPGFGAGGTLSLIAFSLFFGGSILVGNSSWGVLVIFAAGVVLLLIEAAAPGFGIPGIGGLICIGASIILAAGSVRTGILSIAVALILTILTAYVLIKQGYKSPYLDRIILRTKQEKEIGYSGVKLTKEYIGKEGIVITFLRPSGTIEIEGERVDAVSEGSFIEKGAKVKVIKVEGPKIVVRKI